MVVLLRSSERLLALSLWRSLPRNMGMRLGSGNIEYESFEFMMEI